MGAAVARIGDPAIGHPSYDQTAITSGSGNVMAEGIGVARVGDTCSTHTDGNSSHAPSLAGGSGTVMVNGVPMCRVGDMTDCSSAILSGAGTVYAG